MHTCTYMYTYMYCAITCMCTCTCVCEASCVQLGSVQRYLNPKINAVKNIYFPMTQVTFLNFLTEIFPNPRRSSNSVMHSKVTETKFVFVK